MSNYLQYLIWMMLFVIVIEMIFPDSSYRKYLKLVLGCILVYTMLSPIVSLVHVNGADYDSYVRQYQELLGQATLSQGDYNAEMERQQEALKDVYSRSMTSYIEQMAEVEVVDLDIGWEGETLSAIDVIVARPSDTLKIGEIRIGGKEDTLDGDTENLKNKIKTCLSDFYNVQVQNIHITVQKN